MYFYKGTYNKQRFAGRDWRYKNEMYPLKRAYHKFYWRYPYLINESTEDLELTLLSGNICNQGRVTKLIQL